MNNVCNWEAEEEETTPEKEDIFHRAIDFIHLYNHKWAHFIRMCVNYAADFQENFMIWREEELYRIIQYQSSLTHGAWFVECCLLILILLEALFG
jgi:hypothetical protein